MSEIVKICTDCNKLIDETMERATGIDIDGKIVDVYSNHHYINGWLCEKCTFSRKNRGKIAAERQKFYLDADGSCKWHYVGLIDTGSMDEWEPDATDITEELEADPNSELLVTGTCDVCGKNPLRYNYVLKYAGTEKLEEIAGYVSDVSPYGIVGSECIHALSHVDMLKLQRDKKAMEEKHQKANAVVFGEYLEAHVLVPHHEVWKIYWNYNGRDRNLGSSVKYCKEQCLNGVPYQDKEFGKQLKKELAKHGIDVPDLRAIKKLMHTPPEPVKVEPELPDTPDGLHLEFIYGIYPITGKKAVVDVMLVGADGNEVVPDRCAYADDYDPNELLPHTQKPIQVVRDVRDDPVLIALNFLAGHDTDYAEVRNDVGFNKYDAQFGHDLASRSSLTDRQREAAKKLLRKYHRQIPAELYQAIYGDAQ